MGPELALKGCATTSQEAHMNGTILRETLQAILPSDKIQRLAKECGVVHRERKLEVDKLVDSLVLSAGSDDSGVLADAMRRYKCETGDEIVRGAFYAWLDDELAELMQRLLADAMSYAASLPAHLPGILSGVDDWVAFDSETVTLRPALADVFPASGTAAGVKVHKELSIGRGCMIDCHFSPAREHDSPHLVVDERYRGKGLLTDLGYVSIERLSRCDKNDTQYVVRLAEGWKPRVNHVFRGDLRDEFFPGADFDVLLADEVIALDGRCVDAEVVIGTGRNSVKSRLVMIPGPDEYLIYLTNLPRGTHGPKQVGDLYRVRWEIEVDNKLDKSGAQLDQIRATTESSVRIQLCAKLLHSLLVDILVHRDNLERVEGNVVRRAPLHRLVLAYVIRACHWHLLASHLDASSSDEEWEWLAMRISDDARDPNWRSRPSVLDRLLGFTAPRGRPRKKKLRHCCPEAAPYRKAAC
jgi:hypothetical protein